MCVCVCVCVFVCVCVLCVLCVLCVCVCVCVCACVCVSVCDYCTHVMSSYHIYNAWLISRVANDNTHMYTVSQYM